MVPLLLLASCPVTILLPASSRIPMTMSFRPFQARPSCLVSGHSKHVFSFCRPRAAQTAAMPGKLPPGIVQWHTLPKKNTKVSSNTASPTAIAPSPSTLSWSWRWCTSTAEGVTLVGAALNVILAVLKLGAGIFAGSASLVADAGHSLSDLITDAVCMLALRLRNERAEALCTLGIGAILCATGIGMSSAAGVALIPLARAGVARGAHLALRGCDVAALVVAIFSVLSCATHPAPPPHLPAHGLIAVNRSALPLPACVLHRREPSTPATHPPPTTVHVVGARGAARHACYPPALPAVGRGSSSASPPPRPVPLPNQEGMALPHHSCRGHTPFSAHAGSQRLPPPLRCALVGRGHRRRGRHTYT